ncbi:MAG: hypothetical protein M1812_000030 [Candelaria pacifica]|nr:MAG: hypothetical protein M1812_000030 [Candelaria pacifica]
MPHEDLTSDADPGSVSAEPLLQGLSNERPDQDNEHLSQITQASEVAQEYINRALEFVSTASNETLAACLVGICAATYYVLGRLGLLLIGLVGGIALHASWEGSSSGSADDDSIAKEVRRRREVGLDVLTRVLDWRDKKNNNNGIEGTDTGVHKDAVIPIRKELDYSGFAPATENALTELTDAIIRDYVKWWYTPILPTEQLFPETCRQTLIAFVLSISSRLSRKRPADSFLDFVTNSCSIVLVFLNEISAALKASQQSSTPPAEAVQRYLEGNPESSLANVIDFDQQQKKLRVVAGDILRDFLDTKAYNCEPVQTFLREVFAGIVLEMTVESCSKPEWINGWIVFLLEGCEPELLNALDAGMGGVTSGTADSFNTSNDGLGGGAAALAKNQSSTAKQEGGIRDSLHAGRSSKPEDAMETAFLEAQRLNELIAEEDAKRLEQQKLSHVGSSSAVSLSSTEGVMTPTSSRSGREDDEVRNIAIPKYTPIAPNRNQELGTGYGFAESEIDSTPTTAFTSFDQIIPTLQPTALKNHQTQSKIAENLPLTLFKAKISIFDDSMPGEKSTIRTKPTVEYMIQIEPASSHHPGWMISRVYADFETLHEILRRISVISGVTGFTEQHATLPGWKGKTKSALREQLETYTAEALSYRQLADSEGMKRFLEKERGFSQSSPDTNSKGGFQGIGFPNPAALETMGKGMLDVFAAAPKGAAEGGKAVLGGVTGVFGSIGSLGQKRSVPNHGLYGGNKAGSISTSSLARAESIASTDSADWRGSQENIRQLQDLPEKRSSVEQSKDYGSINDAPEPAPALGRLDVLSRESTDLSQHTNHFLPLERDSERTNLGRGLTDAELNLPPPPSDMPDDYGAIALSEGESTSHNGIATGNSSSGALPKNTHSSVPRAAAAAAALPTAAPDASSSTRDAPIRRTNAPITEQETRVTVELLFAVINELYNLSSAWNIRRTFLAAAKTFLLRPGNPNLEAIRVLLQDTLIEANTSDAGIASHVTKIRENAMPTEEELKAWPAPMTDDEKEKLRQKARKLLVERGMPRALTSVMGAAASGEALGRVFDCLQVPAVSRGLIFGLTLQGLKAVTQ